MCRSGRHIPRRCAHFYRRGPHVDLKRSRHLLHYSKGMNGAMVSQGAAVNVLMTTDTVSDLWTLTLDLARGLGKRSVDVFLASLGRLASPQQRAEVAGMDNVTFYESGYRAEWMHGPRAELERAGHWLLELEARCEPDVIHLQGLYHGGLEWRRPRVVSAHFDVLSWWGAALPGLPAGRFEGYRQEIARGLRDVDVVVAPTRERLHALRALYGEIPRARVIRDGRSSLLFDRGEKLPFVLAAGRIADRARNLSLLEEAARQVDCPFYLAGDASPPGATSWCGGRFRFLGELSLLDWSRWLSRAAIFASPARYDPTGLSVMEAAFSGCALVLGDTPETRELWGPAALCVDPDDGEELAMALRYLLRDQRVRQKLADRAYDLAIARTPVRMAAEYAALYAELLGRRTARTQPQPARYR